MRAAAVVLFTPPATAGVTDFLVSVDDYASLSIAGNIVASYDGYPWAEARGSINTAPGLYDINLEYANRYGTNALIFMQRSAGATSYSVIPKNRLFSQDASGNRINGLQATYSTSAGSFTVYGEGPIDHGWSNKYQGTSGAWGGRLGDWDTFSESLSGKIYLGASSEIFAGAVRNRLTNFRNGNPKTVELTFTPNFGFSLSEAASIAGFDHFNWISVVKWAPLGGPFPMLDGIGNTSGGFDTAPYYWEEVPGSGNDPRYVVGNARNTPDKNTLVFEDTPGLGFPFYDGARPFEFITSLVGVRSQINWEIIPGTTWAWKSNNNGLSGGVFDPVHLGTIDPLPWSEGSTFDLTQIGVSEIPAEVLSLLAANGAQNIPAVPEPSISSLLLLGLVSLVRRYKTSIFKANYAEGDA